MPKLKIEINTGNQRGDTIIALRELIVALHDNKLDPDIRHQLRDVTGKVIGYAVIESDIDWGGNVLRLEDM